MKLIQVAVLSLAMGMATAQEKSEAVRDAAITARIETIFLLNRHLSPFDINTNTDHGVVTLTGGVRDEIQRELAEELSASVEAVRQVVNNIIVVPEAPGPEVKRTWKQRIDDRSVKASVRTRLIYHKAFRGLRIGVRVREGVVNLSGIVPTQEQKDRIGQIAYETRGVQNVLNNVSVRPMEKVDSVGDVGRTISDEWVEKRVEMSIGLNRHLSIRGVDVEVNNRVCILTGIVDTEPQKELAGNIANSILGVISVQNDLKVRHGPPEELKLFEPADGLPQPETPVEALPERPRDLPRVLITPIEP